MIDLSQLVRDCGFPNWAISRRAGSKRKMRSSCLPAYLSTIDNCATIDNCGPLSFELLGQTILLLSIEVDDSMVS